MRTASARIALIATIGLQAACDPAPDFPITGEIRFEHVRSTPASLQFQLINQSKLAIKIEADPTEDAHPKPRYVKWSCRNTSTSDWREGAAPDFNRNFATFSLEPGFATELHVTSEMLPPGWDPPLDRCRIAVVRADGQSDILSDEFPPYRR